MPHLIYNLIIAILIVIICYDLVNKGPIEKTGLESINAQVINEVKYQTWWLRDNILDTGFQTLLSEIFRIGGALRNSKVKTLCADPNKVIWK